MDLRVFVLAGMTKVMGVGQMETVLPLISSLLFHWGDSPRYCARVGGVRQ